VCSFPVCVVRTFRSASTASLKACTTQNRLHRIDDRSASAYGGENAGEEFGEDKLVALAVAGRAKGAEAVLNAILGEIERFEQGARATDDRTLVVLKREAAA